jgi:hypothetical protein
MLCDRFLWGGAADVSEDRVWGLLSRRPTESPALLAKWDCSGTADAGGGGGAAGDHGSARCCDPMIDATSIEGGCPEVAPDRPPIGTLDVGDVGAGSFRFTPAVGA